MEDRPIITHTYPARLGIKPPPDGDPPAVELMYLAWAGVRMLKAQIEKDVLADDQYETYEQHRDHRDYRRLVRIYKVLKNRIGAATGLPEELQLLVDRLRLPVQEYGDSQDCGGIALLEIIQPIAHKALIKIKQYGMALPDGTTNPAIEVYYLCARLDSALRIRLGLTPASRARLEFIGQRAGLLPWPEETE